MFIKNKKLNNKKRGFTLIELLVVISIISVLSTVVFASLNDARSKARDAKRISDLQNIRLALELYRDRTGHYPIHINVVNSTQSNWVTSLGSELTDIDLSKAKDPINRNTSNAGWSLPPILKGDYAYLYASTSDGDKYDLFAQLENKSPTSCDPDDPSKKVPVYTLLWGPAYDDACEISRIINGDPAFVISDNH